MSFFDEVTFAADEEVTPSATQEQDSQSDDDFFSTIKFAEDTSVPAAQTTSTPTADVSDISDDEMYQYLQSSRKMTDEEKIQAKTKMKEEKLLKQAKNVQINVDAIYNKYNLPTEIGALAGNKDAQIEVEKETEMLKAKTIQELASLGVESYFAQGELYVVNEQGQAIKASDPGILDTIYSEKGTTAGAITGAITGARAGLAVAGPWGALGGGLVGSAVGAAAGSGVDALVANLDMINKAEVDVIYSKMLDAGIADLVLGSTVSAVAKPVELAAKPVASYLVKVYDYLLSNNPQGAIDAIMLQTNQTREQAMEAVRKYEQYMGKELTGTDAEKIAEVAIHTPGAEKLLHGASGTDNSNYITQVANDVFNRANITRTQIENMVKPESVKALEKELETAIANKEVDRVADIKLELQEKDMYNLISNDLQAYTKKVKDMYKSVKDAPTEFIKDYQFDINKLAIEPLLNTKGKHIEDEVIRNRWLARLSKIEDLADGNKSFQDLQDLYKYINQMERDTPRASVIDRKVLSQIKDNISKEIQEAANTHIPMAKEWLEAWGTANKQYAIMKTMEDSVMLKALTKEGVSAEDITKAFLKFRDAGDDTFYKVVDKLPKATQSRVEGALIQHFTDARTSGLDGMKVIDFPMLAKDLNTMHFRDPNHQQAATHINHMAQVFKNDINLAKASGMIATPHFQSYLTTDPIVRAKFAFASHVFNRISQLKPGESADNFAAYKLMGKVFKNPLDQSSIKLLDDSLKVKDRRVQETVQDIKPLVADMQNQYMQRQIGLRQLMGKDVPPLLVWKSDPAKLEKLNNPDATILPSPKEVLYATAKGTVGNDISQTMLTERSSDLFTEFIFRNTNNPKFDIQDKAEELLNSKRFDSIIKDTRRKLKDDDNKANKEMIRKLVDRETEQLSKVISSFEGVKLPESELKKLRQIIQLRLMEE